MRADKWICWLFKQHCYETNTESTSRGSADCRVDAFEMNRICRTTFITNI